MSLRHCQMLLVASLGFHLLLVVFNNVSDYGTNLAFVQHVLSMDTLFAESGGHWRALKSPAMHHTFYVVIILWELAAAALCLAGAARLWRHRAEAPAVFHRAKQLAIAGLTVALLLWFVGFLTIGAEWFLMWQSRQWNGQVAATRLFLVTGLILLVLLQADARSEHENRDR